MLLDFSTYLLNFKNYVVLFLWVKKAVIYRCYIKQLSWAALFREDANVNQLTFTSAKSTVETLEKGDVVLVILLLTLSPCHLFFLFLKQEDAIADTDQWFIKFLDAKTAFHFNQLDTTLIFFIFLVTFNKSLFYEE